MYNRVTFYLALLTSVLHTSSLLNFTQKCLYIYDQVVYIPVCTNNTSSNFVRPASYLSPCFLDSKYLNTCGLCSSGNLLYLPSLPISQHAPDVFSIFSQKIFVGPYERNLPFHRSNNYDSEFM